MRVQTELYETNVVLHKTIDSLLERGEKLSDLMARSEILSEQSRLFMKRAKKLVFPPCNLVLMVELLLPCHVGENNHAVYQFISGSATSLVRLFDQTSL